MKEFLDAVSVEKAPAKRHGWIAADLTEKPRWGQGEDRVQRTAPATLASQRVSKEEAEALASRLEIMGRMGLCRERKCGRREFEKCKDPHGCGIALKEPEFLDW